VSHRSGPGAVTRLGAQPLTIRVTGQVRAAQDGKGTKRKRQRDTVRKPKYPDGIPEDGCDGTALEDGAKEEEEVVVHPGNLWRHKPKVQIRYIKRALERLSHAMWVWNEAAAAAYKPGQRSTADDVLEGLWKRRELRLRQLAWLRSEIPVDPLTGKDVEGEEEDAEDDGRRAGGRALRT
jgi:hypothetical protein